MLRGNIMNALSGFERLLLFLGLLLLSVYAAARIYRSLYSHLAVHEFWGSHGSLTAGNPTSASRRKSLIDSSVLPVALIHRSTRRELA